MYLQLVLTVIGEKHTGCHLQLWWKEYEDLKCFRRILMDVDFDAETIASWLNTHHGSDLASSHLRTKSIYPLHQFCTGKGKKLLPDLIFFIVLIYY